MDKAIIKACLIILFLLMGTITYSQDAGAIRERVFTKTISIDSLKKIEYLEDLLDSFPKKDYYVYYCYITRSGKGFLTSTTVVDNDVNRYNPKSPLRCPIINTLFDIPDRPVKPGQKYIFDRIFIRKFKDKNSSEPWSTLELYITD
jgi:hypothetical protein